MATGTTDIQLNAEQKKAVTHGDGPLLIVAGAGTGKTTVVTQRIFWFMQEKKVKPEQILALTFTEKAAEEMVERIDRALPYGYGELWVSTFHAFCQRVLTEHGLDIGIPNDFRLVNTTDAWLLVRKNLERFDLDYYRPLGNPTKFIHALVRHFSRCKDEAVGPEEYLEYAKTVRLDRDVDNSPLSPLILRGEIPPLSARGGSAFGGKVSHRHWRGPASLKNNSGGEGGEEGLSNTEVQRIHELANAYHTYQQLLLENSALDFGDLLTYTLKLFRERPAILEEYQKKFHYMLVDEFQDTNWTQYELLKLLAAPKNNITVVSDDDQAIYRWRGASYNNVVVFARDFPDAKKVSLVANYRSKQNILDCAYAFIQHNNPNRLEAQLQQSTTPSVSDRATLGVTSGVVGIVTKKLLADRSGNGVITYLHASTAFDEARVVVQKILDLRSANPKSEILNPKQIPNSKSQIPNWSDFCILLRANAMADPFIRALERAGIPYQFMASRGLYAKPVILDCIAYLRLLDNYHESTALYRVAISPVARIPHNDLVTLTHYSEKKSVSLYEAMHLAATLNISKEGLGKCTALLQWIARHSALARTKTVGEVLYAFLRDTGYEKELTKRLQHAGDAFGEDVERLSYVRQFFKKVEAFEASEREPNVKNFLDAFAYAIESGEEGSLENDIESGPDTVKLMTVHSAKGLEFLYIFIVQMVELRFPSVDRRDPIMLPDALVKEIIPEGDAHLEEERRLFYVAMTRARDGLFLTSADDYGGTRTKRPSRFLYEAGIIEKVSAKGGSASGGKSQKSKAIGSILMTHKQDTQTQRIQMVQLPLPEKFSYTQLKAFTTCPLQYKFAHLLKIPVQGRGTFSFGKTMHATMQKFFERMIDGCGKEQQDLFGRTQSVVSSQLSVPSLDDLFTIYDECWIDEWYDSKEEKKKYYDHGKELLKEFYALHDGQWTMPKALEKRFTMKVEDIVLKGAIDRIDPLSDGVEIIDYKTGNPKEKLDDDDRTQLLIYQVAATEVLGEQPRLLSYWYFEKNQKLSFLGTTKEIDAVKEKIVETVAAIRASDFAATPSPYVCRKCDFRDICEYRQL